VIDASWWASQMSNKKTPGPIRILALGAMNGLLVGLALEKARITFLNYHMSQAAREYARSDWTVDFINARLEPLIPLVCVSTFAVVAFSYINIL